MFLRSLLPLLPLLSLHLTPTSAQSTQTPLQLSCDPSDSTDFESFLNALLTVLHYSGNTDFEQVVAGFSATEDGYEVLEGVWQGVGEGEEGWSLLVPSNEAFTASGLSQNYTTLPEPTLYSLFTYHTLPHSISTLAPSSSPQFPDTLFPTYTGTGEVLQVIYPNAGGDLSVVGNVGGGGNGMVKGDSIDKGDQAGLLGGLELYSVDKIFTPPPSFPTVLASTSATLYSSALDRTDTLKTIQGFSSSGAKNGFTVFVPVDKAFSGEMVSNNEGAWTKVLAGHYTSTQALYSNGFNSSSKLFMANGNSLTFVTNSSGTFVQPNDGSAAAKVLQMDLSVDGGGVVHVVDGILASSALTTNGTSNSNPNGSGSGKKNDSYGATGRAIALTPAVGSIGVGLLGLAAMSIGLMV